MTEKTAMGDDTLGADAALRLMKKGTAIVWQGDFHNAKLLLQAVARRLDSPPAAARPGKKAPPSAPAAAGLDFYRYRQKRALRARLLGLLLVTIERPAATNRYTLALRRAPDIHAACSQAWDCEAAALDEAAAGQAPPALLPGHSRAVPLRALLGTISSHEWRKKGIAISALGESGKIYPHYGVFSPLRGEYIPLVAEAADPHLAAATVATAFDIGTGTGVLAAVLAQRGVQQVVATDVSHRALVCARANIGQLGLQAQVSVLQADLYPPGRADLLVCNPPWLPGKAASSLEAAVYDEGSRMLLGFLAGARNHLQPNGEAWLVLSDLAEHLGLRSRAELLAAIAKAGLQVVGKTDIRPSHPKSQDPNDPLHAARQQEMTSLWRLKQAEHA